MSDNILFKRNIKALNRRRALRNRKQLELKRKKKQDIELRRELKASVHDVFSSIDDNFWVLESDELYDVCIFRGDLSIHKVIINGFLVNPTVNKKEYFIVFILKYVSVLPDSKGSVYLQMGLPEFYIRGEFLLEGLIKELLG